MSESPPEQRSFRSTCPKQRPAILGSTTGECSVMIRCFRNGRRQWRSIDERWKRPTAIERIYEPLRIGYGYPLALSGGESCCPPEGSRPSFQGHIDFVV